MNGINIEATGEREVNTGQGKEIGRYEFIECYKQC